MTAPLILRSACLAILAVAAFAGCASSQTAAKKEKQTSGRFMVGVRKSPFYKYGPAQSFGPDFALPQGQKLTLITQGFGFSRVMTDDGISGYMPTEDLVPAVADAVPAVPAAPRLASRRPGKADAEVYSGPVRKSRPIERMDDAPPLFDVFDVPLPSDPETSNPSTESKAKTAEPKFRANRLN